MEALGRPIVIFLEVLLLTALLFVILEGVRLLLADLGIGPKYQNIIIMSLGVVTGMLVIFFIVHLISFYPGAGELIALAG